MEELFSSMSRGRKALLGAAVTAVVLLVLVGQLSTVILAVGATFAGLSAWTIMERKETLGENRALVVGIVTGVIIAMISVFVAQGVSNNGVGAPTQAFAQEANGLPGLYHTPAENPEPNTTGWNGTDQRVYDCGRIGLISGLAAGAIGGPPAGIITGLGGCAVGGTAGPPL